MTRRSEHLQEIDEALEHIEYKKREPALERAAIAAAYREEIEEMLKTTRLIRLLMKMGEPTDEVRGHRLTKRVQQLVREGSTLSEAKQIESDEDEQDDIEHGHLVPD